MPDEEALKLPLFELAHYQNSKLKWMVPFWGPTVQDFLDNCIRITVGRYSHSVGEKAQVWLVLRIGLSKIIFRQIK
jgi:hypothetical protein